MTTDQSAAARGWYSWTARELRSRAPKTYATIEAAVLADAPARVETLPTSGTVWTGEPLLYRAAVLEALAVPR